MGYAVKSQHYVQKGIVCFVSMTDRVWAEHTVQHRSYINKPITSDGGGGHLPMHAWQFCHSIAQKSENVECLTNVE